MTGPLLQQRYGQVLKLVEEVAQSLRPVLASHFGPKADLRWLDGEWQAGYRSEYGFHLRGHGPTPELAAADAIRGRFPSDPSPAQPTLPPAGTYKRGN